jgi:hypothetical protein
MGVSGMLRFEDGFEGTKRIGMVRTDSGRLR